MQLPEFLVDVNGEVVLRGHRIGLFHVVSRYNDGYSPEMIVCQYPTLPLALVHKTIAFYLENRTDVDAYVEQCQAELDRQRADGKSLDVEQLRRLSIAMP